MRRGERGVSRRRRDPRGEEPGKDACEEHAVEGAGSTDGDYGRAEFGDAREVPQVRADERAERACDVGDRGRLPESPNTPLRPRSRAPNLQLP